MSANSNLLLLFLVILQSVLSAGQSTASTTLLITGHSSNNIYKYAFAQKFASQVELDRAHSADIVVISSDLTDTVSQEEGAVLQKLGGTPLSANITQVVLSRLGVDEMSLDHIQVLFQYIDNDEPLIAVEIGEQSVQMRSLLKKGALCWGEARANILSPNTAYLCNDVSPEAVKKVADIDSIHAIEEGTRLEIFEPQPRPFWPSLFASAAKAEKKHRRKQAEEVIEVDDDVEEIVDQIMENIQETPSKHHKIDKPTDKKLSCKYRRSCYDSGQLPEIEKSNTGWYDLNTINNLFTFGGKKEDETHDESDGDKDEISRKLECKYRLDCYKRKGIKLTGKDEEREERKSLLAGQATPQTGKKRTLKEIAEKTVKNVKVAQEKAAARPIPASIITERKLNKIEEKLTEKLQCKYRKSCYETGELPIIASSWSLPDFSTHTAEEAVQEVDFKEMEDLERKMFCKYRKSCYETGVKPDIEPEIRITTFADLGDLPDVIETRKMTIQEKCKYRKSCYESGILPEINPHLEEAIHKEVSTVIPTNMDELKKFCKYRKSCYEEIASSASVETVKNIRKRRIVEKEVRRRKARRSRMRRRLRDIQLEPIGTEHHHKNKHYTVQHPEPEVPVEDDVITEKVSITKPRKTKEKAAKQEEEKQEPEKTKAQKKKISIAAEVPKQSDLVEEEEEVQQAVDEAPKPKKRVRKSPDVIREPEAVKRKESPVEVSEPVPDEQEQVEESTPIPEPPKPKKVKKTSKKTPEPREEPKVEPEVIEQLKKKEEEEEDKEKLGYEENQKLQYHCKYRKSCYESKERPVIHQTVSTLYNTFDTHVNEHYKSLENQDISEADKKLACKYRKSCYESNERPVIVQTFSTIWAGAEPVREDDNDDEIKFHNELEKKVYCKYRLSCYETNKRPRIGQTLSSILTGKPVAQATKNEDGHEALEKDHSWHSEEHKKMACKYRQSCYDKHSWKFGQEEDHKKPEPAKESQKLVPEVKPVQEPKRDKKNDEIITEKKAKGSQKEPEKPKSVPKSENSEEEEAEEEHIKVSDEVLPDLGRGQKLGCKYRKSCYLDAPSMEPPTRAVSSNGSHQRVKCNEYYLSCREKLGLPPKEKAPMGPNGKKLCRRKKIDQ